MEVHDDRILDSTGYSHSHLHASLTLLMNEGPSLTEFITNWNSIFNKSRDFGLNSTCPFPTFGSIHTSRYPLFYTYYKVNSQHHRWKKLKKEVTGIS